jgi:3-phosphoshikimate 1-carboxyvinyltransferase
MRLLAGLAAGLPLTVVLAGDDSLSTRPMERVAEPLRTMGARVSTTDGRAPVTVEGGGLRGIIYRSPVPSAQVKSAVLLAGLGAEGVTTVEETVQTRDHTERALLALGAPISTEGTAVRLESFQHEGFEGRVPGDPSSAAFIVAAAALTGSEITIRGVGLNPSRLHFLDVMARMGVRTEVHIHDTSVGEPVGDLWVAGAGGIDAVTVAEDEIPLIIDEIPVLAAMAAHASQDSWFLGVSELRVKESDRLAGVADGLTGLGARAAAEGEDLVVAGGGVRGGWARAGGDHRMAMALVVAALGADGPCEIDGAEAADVSFPGFAGTLAALGAHIRVAT